MNGYPASTLIYVDDVYRGTFPLLALPLPPGRHQLRLELDGFKKLTAPVDIRAGEMTKKLNLRLEPLAP